MEVSLTSLQFLLRVSCRVSSLSVFMVSLPTSQLKPVWIDASISHCSKDQDTINAFPCHIYLRVHLWIMNSHSRTLKENTSHGNEVLSRGTIHLIQRPCYQWWSPCQDPAGNWTTWRSPVDCKETNWSDMVMSPNQQVWQNHLARHNERGKKTRQTEEEVGRQHQGMDRPGVQQVPEGSGEQGKMETTGCKTICVAPTTLAVKGLMMMMK